MDTIQADCERIGILLAAKLYGVTKQFLYGHIKALEPQWWDDYLEAQQSEVSCDICDGAYKVREYPRHRRFCESMPTPEETIKALQKFGIKDGSARLCITPAQARERVKRKYRAELRKLAPPHPRNRRTVKACGVVKTSTDKPACRCGILLSSSAGQRDDGKRCEYCADEASGIESRPAGYTVGQSEPIYRVAFERVRR